MKYEWKKSEKKLYLSKTVPTIVEVPRHKFFSIKGFGNPNNKDFSERVGVLYSLAYAVRMMPRNGFTPEGYFEYTVYPLEGIWDLSDKGKKMANLDKNELVYTIMIRQPEFVDEDVFNKALEIAKKKKDSPLLNEVIFGEIEDGLCVQMLHNGSYDSEVISFDKMKEFIKINNLEQRILTHREIYISDNRKVEPDKLKTVLRYFVSTK